MLGEVVHVPADMTGGQAGYYEVLAVEYHYEPAQDTDIPEDIGPAKLVRIQVEVRKALPNAATPKK